MSGLLKQMKLLTFDDLGTLALMLLKRTPFVGTRRLVGSWLGDLDPLLRGGRRRKVIENLRRFYPMLSDSKLEELTRQVFHDRWSAASQASRVEVEGLERLRAALKRRKGVILWESPFGSRAYLHLALLRAGISFTQVHGAEHGGSNSWLGQHIVRRIHRAVEERVVPEVVEIQEGTYSYLRLIKARLGANRIVCMPGLGPKGRRFIRLDCLGGREFVATGVISLALSTGGALMPVYCFRASPGVWKTVFEEPLRLDNIEDKREAQVAAAKHYAELVESYVRRYPEQWRRWHVASARSPGRDDLPACAVDLSEPRGQGEAF